MASPRARWLDRLPLPPWARRIGAKQTWLTHIAHELGHEATNRVLPDGVSLAYDGLRIPVTLASNAHEPEAADA